VSRNGRGSFIRPGLLRRPLAGSAGIGTVGDARGIRRPRAPRVAPVRGRGRRAPLQPGQSPLDRSFRGRLQHG